MTDTVRVLLSAAVLSLSAFAAFAWRVSRTEAAGPERLVGQLRLAQWAAVLLASTGGAAIGFAATQATIPMGTIDVTVAVLCVLLAGLVVMSEPRVGLLVAGAGFLAHALFDVAHRPGGLSDALMPRWFIVGAAAWDLSMSAICFWARRR
ncbi:MAG TPA: hypothetical protein VMM93_04465 [Vicinamibacterales bacterium]|nr:hypothetical protein [Vicinamibacterales bacterium]